MSIDDEILNSNLVLMKFYSQTCCTCKILEPIVNELANSYKGKLKLINVDIYENTKIARKYGIQSVPTMLFFKNGGLAGRMAGFKDRKTIAEKIDNYLST